MGLVEASPANYTTQDAVLRRASHNALWDTKSVQTHPGLATHTGIHNTQIQMLPQGHKKLPAQPSTTAWGASVLLPTYSQPQLTREP